MELGELMVRLESRLKEQLPGQTAHEVMRASPVGSVIPKFDHTLPPRPGSVLILLYQDAEGRIKFPLIKRPDYLGTHSGQVSFPGGKAEPGENYLQTALREAEEEIGVRSVGLKVIGRLSDFFVIPSNFLVTPVVAYSEQQPVFVADTIEVVRILKGDLLSLLPDDAIKTKEITVARQFQLMAPHFEIEGEVVWGATAMILNELRVILRELI